MWSVFCIGQIPLGMMINLMTLHWRKWIFLFQHLSIPSRFLTRHRTWCLFSLLSVRILSCLSLCSIDHAVRVSVSSYVCLSWCLSPTLTINPEVWIDVLINIFHLEWLLQILSLILCILPMCVLKVKLRIQKVIEKSWDSPFLSYI